MRRTACGGCGGTDLEVFLDLGLSPLADAFPADPLADEIHYPLQLAVCRDCWLVQLTEIVDDELLFGDDYGFYSSTSPSLVDYDQQFAAWVKQRWFGLPVVEIACNDGSLLRHFPHAVGVEPAAGPAQKARARGLDVIGEPFTAALASRFDRGPRLVIAKNVLAHVADLDDFLAGVAALIGGGGGAAVFEVQHLADLLLGNQFDHVYHEHRYYFTIGSLSRLLTKHNLTVTSVQSTPAQGGSLRVVAERRPGSAEIAHRWLDSPDAYADVQSRAEHLRTRLLDLLANLRGVKVAGYAASAKSTTLLNWCGIGFDLLDHVADTTPYKVGRFTPGTHIPIVAPGERPTPDVYLLLAWNYLSGVLRREREFLDGGGRFIVPIPQPTVI